MVKIINESTVQVDAPELRDENEKHIILTVRDDQSSIYNLLDCIRYISDMGHSFTVVVDPGDKDEQKFFIDGDGCDKIFDIKINKYEGDKSES